MGLPLSNIETHIATWQTALKKTSRPHRSNWPARLFRHEPLENAAAILRQGELRSRAAAEGEIVLDIAPDEIINLTDAGHQLVRLYFRPRTPTQYRIEGVRKPSEFYKGKHAPTLCMMLFSAKKILSRQDVQFSSGNVQHSSSVIHGNLAGFDEIDFASVYHEGPFNTSDPANHDLVRKRCAEVLCPNPLLLDEALQAIMCRSHAERQTLMTYLGDQAGDWAHKIKIFSEAGLFCADYAYVESVDISPGGLKVKFHPRKDGATVNVEVRCRGLGAGLPSYKWDATDRAIGTPWNFTCGGLTAGTYRVSIKLEGVQAYKANLTLADQPF